MLTRDEVLGFFGGDGEALHDYLTESDAMAEITYTGSATVILLKEDGTKVKVVASLTFEVQP